MPIVNVEELLKDIINTFLLPAHQNNILLTNCMKYYYTILEKISSFINKSFDLWNVINQEI